MHAASLLPDWGQKDKNKGKKKTERERKMKNQK